MVAKTVKDTDDIVGVPVEKAKAKEKLKTLPHSGIGLSQYQAVRTVKLAQPICPMSKIEMEKDLTGKWVAKQGPTDPDRMNCQRLGWSWWNECEAKGHNPYFREIVWYVTEDVFDDETGELTGSKKFRRARIIPNIKQVGVAAHLNSGNGARRAIKNKGCKRLPEIGYEEVCQYRNCMKPVSKEASTRTYGNYCCTDELALVVADQQGVILPRPDLRLNGDEEHDKVVRLRKKMLNEALASALGT